MSVDELTEIFVLREQNTVLSECHIYNIGVIGPAGHFDNCGHVMTGRS